MSNSNPQSQPNNTDEQGGISMIDDLLGDLVGKVLDHSQMRMPGEVQMYKMYIERTTESLEKLITEQVIGEDLPIVQPLDNELDPIQCEGNRLFRKGANWVKENQRKALKQLFGGQTE